jgi:hypothetical protein
LLGRQDDRRTAEALRGPQNPAGLPRRLDDPLGAAIVEATWKFFASVKHKPAISTFGLDGTLFVPGVIAIVWPTKDIAARTHPVCLTELLGAGLLIVMRCAQTGQLIERRKCLQNQALLPAALGNRDSVVDNFRSRDFPRLQAGFATRMLR